jgi:class 3 adenylate cyclase
MPENEELYASFLIADLAGYTSLTETHGDHTAADLLSRYATIVRESLREDTVLVDRIGDEVLMTSTNTQNLLDTGLDLLGKLEREPGFPSIHMGLHAGNVIRRDRRYFGTTLNLTSRICSHSRGGQLLCSHEVVKSVHTTGKYDFLSLGDIRFKNISRTVAVYEVLVKSRRGDLSMDRVCRMQVDNGNPPAKLPYNGRTYYFCSYRCSKKFIENPERYA